MKKVTIWVATGLMVLGIVLFAGICVAIDFDFTRLDTVKFITNSYDITDSFDSICVDTITADIDIRPSEDGKCRVVCYDREKLRHSVSVSDGTLLIAVEDDRNWLDHITVFSLNTPAVTVYLPEGEYRTLKVKNTTGDMELSGDWRVEELQLTTTTGDIHVRGISSQGNVAVHATTGDILLEDMTCKSLTTKGSTGDAVLKNMIASDSMRIERTTGDITLDKCDAGALFIDATTGDVTGTLLTAKVISAQATTGEIDVPKYTTGGRCEITVTTGDIRIDIP